jgi:hypothetical protein
MPRTVAAIAVLTAILLGLGVVRAAGAGPKTEADPQLRAEVVRLLALLDDDQFEVRRRAAAGLEAMVTRPELGRLLAGEFQRAAADPRASFEVRWHLERWLRRLPLVPPFEGKPAEEVSAEELQRLVRELDDDSYGVRLGAARRLEWLLLREENLPRIRQVLEARLAEGVDAETTSRLRRLLDLARPAMVAECWQGRRHVSEQHLLIGVPSLGPGAARPSHFDRIDDRAAHCVSGHNLSPGDYPVGVAFPHPDPMQQAFFHLVNLPSPWRRIEYRRYVQTDQAERLAAISRRTLRRMLAERRELTPSELLMLAQLDPQEVSRFASEYFHAVEDGPLPSLQPQPQPVTALIHARAGGYPSRFGLVCVQLALDGTKEAIPGLLKAIDKRRFLPPTPACPHQFPWMAALSIAARDPWPEVEPWLGGLLGRDDVLVDGAAEGPRLGATAAAVLLRRRGQSLSEFGLEPAPGPAPRPGIDGYRFSSPDAQKKLQQWWQQEQERQKQL